jgi:hypothetical protein
MGESEREGLLEGGFDMSGLIWGERWPVLWTLAFLL